MVRRHALYQPGFALAGGIDITAPGISSANPLSFTIDGKAVTVPTSAATGAGGTFAAADIMGAINGTSGIDVTASVSGNAIVLTQKIPSATPISVTGADDATVFGGSLAPAPQAGILPTAFTTTRLWYV